MSTKDFNKTLYDPYPSGTAFILTGDLSLRIYECAIGFPFSPFSLWLDDVYFGMIATKLGTKLVNIFSSYVPQNHYAQYSMEKKIELLVKNGLNRSLFIFTNENEYNELWHFLNRYYNRTHIFY